MPRSRWPRTIPVHARPSNAGGPDLLSAALLAAALLAAALLAAALLAALPGRRYIAARVGGV
jgi:hypothetical protein